MRSFKPLKVIVSFYGSHIFPTNSKNVELNVIWHMLRTISNTFSIRTCMTFVRWSFHGMLSKVCLLRTHINGFGLGFYFLSNPQFYQLNECDVTYVIANNHVKFEISSNVSCKTTFFGFANIQKKIRAKSCFGISMYLTDDSQKYGRVHWVYDGNSCSIQPQVMRVSVIRFQVLSVGVKHTKKIAIYQQNFSNKRYFNTVCSCNDFLAERFLYSLFLSSKILQRKNMNQTWFVAVYFL